MSQRPLLLGVRPIRPVTLKLLVLGLPTFWLGVICAGASLSERPLQDGGDVPRSSFVNVSLASDLGDQSLVFLLVAGEAPAKLLQQRGQLTRRLG